MVATRDDLAARFRSDQAKWRALVAQVDRARMDEPGPMGEWTFKDLVGHLGAWRGRNVARLEAAARGEPRPANPWPDAMAGDDPINDWFRERDRDRPVEDLLGEYDESFDRMAGALAALPDDAIMGEADTPGYYRWRDTEGEVQSDFFNHLDVHMADVVAWLETTGQSATA